MKKNLALLLAVFAGLTLPLLVCAGGGNVTVDDFIADHKQSYCDFQLLTNQIRRPGWSHSASYIEFKDRFGALTSAQTHEKYDYIRKGLYFDMIYWLEKQNLTKPECDELGSKLTKLLNQ